jgi:hypothetical protein
VAVNYNEKGRPALPPGGAGRPIVFVGLTPAPVDTGTPLGPADAGRSSQNFGGNDRETAPTTLTKRF